jgi:flagellar FliL protein
VEQEGADGATPPAAAKKGGGIMKWLILTVLVVGIGGGGAAWWLAGSSSAASAEASEPSLDARGLVAFEPFLVNLADQGGNRFLKATIQLVLESPEQATHVEETLVVKSHLRSAILELLTQQSAPALVTQDGKDALKAAIKTRTTPLLADAKVLDVLFSEFVVQF